MNGAVLIADAGDLDFWDYWTRPGSTVSELAIVFGILLVLVVGIFYWAAFVRAPRRRRHSYHQNQTSADGSPIKSPRRRRRRHRLLRILRRQRRQRRRHRRPHRPVNPTLAQVGGLPPPRHEHPPVP